jgi:hypothetical protein
MFKREKLFGFGRPRPQDREAKCRIMVHARALMRRTEPGKAYGLVTAKTYAVLEALLWGFHNAANGLCFPSYEKIAERAACARSTVAEAIKVLEAIGLLTWTHTLKRVGKGELRRVVRSSNAYVFNDPRSKSDFPSGTSIKESFSLVPPPVAPATAPPTELELHLAAVHMRLFRKSG